MDILYRNEPIGQIVNTYREDYWVHGSFIPYPTYDKYRSFLDALVCEQGMDESQFSVELFDENNWFVQNAMIFLGYGCLPYTRTEMFRYDIEIRK